MDTEMKEQGMRVNSRTRSRIIRIRACGRPAKGILLLLLLFGFSAGLRAQANVFWSATQELVISCIRNTGFGENGLPQGYAFTAVRGIDNVVVIDPGSIRALATLPASCNDRVSFTFEPTGEIASLDMDIFNLTVMGSSETFDVRLISRIATDILRLQIFALIKNEDNIEDVVLNQGGNRSLFFLSPAYVNPTGYPYYQPPHRLETISGANPPLIDSRDWSNPYVIDSMDTLSITTQDSAGTFLLTLFGTESSGQIVNEKILITVCGTNTYAADDQCNEPAGINLCEGSFDVRTLADLAQISSCNVITGDLAIDFSSGLTSLSGLNQLSRLGGNLGITNNKDLSSLNGLENLEHVGGAVLVYANAELASLQSLQSLREVGGYFGVANNLHLQTIGTLSVRSIAGKLWIQNNNQLTSVAGFDELSEAGSVEISDNRSLVGPLGFNGLHKVRSGIRILRNDALTSVEGFHNLMTAQLIEIQEHSNLSFLAAFENLTALSSLYVGDNPVLHSLAGFGNLQQLSSLHIINSKALKTLSGFSRLMTLDNLYLDNNALIKDINALLNIRTLENLTISAMPGLIDLSGLNNLELVSNGILLSDNANLLNLDALANLKIANGELRIAKTPSLRDLSGLNNLESLGSFIFYAGENVLIHAVMNRLQKITGSVELRGSAWNTGFPELTEIDGSLSYSEFPGPMSIDLPKLKSIGGNLQLAALSISDFRGFEQLTSIGDMFSVYENPNLLSFTGLENLQTVGSLFISTNPQLEGFTALKALHTVRADIRIDLNQRLKNLRGLDNVAGTISNLAVDWNNELVSLDGLSGLRSVTGFILISNNDSLVNLDGLDNLTSAGAILLNENISLPEAESEGMLRRLGF